MQATELYLEATRLEVSGSQASVQRQAQSDAQSELDALLPRVPSIVIQVNGAESAQLQIDLDGTSVPSGLVGAKRPTDPGAHVITVRHGERTKQQRINLVERNSQVFDFSADAAASKAVDSPATGHDTQVEGSSSASSSGAPARSKPGSTQRTLGWVSLGVGGAGLVVGGIFGGIALAQKGSLDDKCRDSVCPPSSYDAVDKYYATRAVSTVGFIVGGVGVAAGVTLLLTAPSKPSDDGGSVAAWLGPHGAGLQGTF